MNVSIIGSGNVAAVLARLCLQKGHTIQQILARNTEAAQELAQEVGGRADNICTYIPLESDLIIVALSDHSLPQALAELYFKGVPVVHTAGAVSIHVLKNNADNYGVLYPLQSLRKEMGTIPPIPFLIEANNENTFQFIQNFAATLCDNVIDANEAYRLKLHAAAVVVNNFTNYLYILAEDFCKKENVDFDLLKPLIKETAERIQDRSPGLLQTGPAVRNDITTIKKHLELISGYPELMNIYELLTVGIKKNSQ